MTEASALWRRLDRPGHEAARLRSCGSEWHLDGASVFMQEGQPCRLDYLVICDSRWQTVSAHVTGWIGDTPVEVQVAAGSGEWRLNGTPCPQVEGCIDIDINFTPSTNLVAIRRLNLEIGQEAAVNAAWLRFPQFTLEPLDQTYRRIADAVYRYESGGGRFAADLVVTPAGFVAIYPGFWQVEDRE